MLTSSRLHVPKSSVGLTLTETVQCAGRHQRGRSHAGECILSPDVDITFLSRCVNDTRLRACSFRTDQMSKSIAVTSSQANAPILLASCDLQNIVGFLDPVSLLARR